MIGSRRTARTGRQPCVSVVMAVRDGARFLRQALDSVLGQTLRDLELVVVDDGSVDGSRAVLASCLDPRLIRLENPVPLGLAASLNRGVAVARAELIARQDADDVSHPERLARQVAALHARPDLALLGTRGRVIDAGGAYLGPLDRCLELPAILWYHLLDNPFIHSAVVFRRSVILDDLGGFDESFPYAQDWELWSRVLRRRRAANLPDRLVDYRAHPGSLTFERHEPGVYRAIVARIVARNVEATLGERLTALEVELLTGFVLGLERDRIPAFLDLLFRLAARFRQLHIAGEGEPERTLAAQLDTLAACARPPSRGAVLAVHFAALRRDPSLARWLAWHRVIGRLAGGPFVGRRLRQLRRAGGSVMNVR
jgi:hypothetical protein